MYGNAPMGNMGRARITQALMNIQNPPPRTQMPGAMPGMATGYGVQTPGASMSPATPGMTGGGMPGAMPGAAPGTVPPMSMQGSAAGMPGGSQFAPPLQPAQSPQMTSPPPAAGQPLY